MSGSEHRRVVCVPVEDLEALERQWVALQGRAECSYFQSWGWIGTWLREVVPDLAPQVMHVYSGQQLVGLGIFVERDFRRRHLFPVRAAFLNSCPFNGRDMTIEYNGLLVGRDHEEAVYRAVLDHLFSRDASLDEIHLDAVSESLPLSKYLVDPDKVYRLRTEGRSPAWQVDLTQLGDGLDAYLGTLGKNRRAQIRRALKFYGGKGGLQVQEADSPSQALKFFAELEALHTRSWLERGEPGAFANLRWTRFHEQLIRCGFPLGQTQLLKISSGATVVGLIYSFVWRSTVYVQQTGFNRWPDRRSMPGYVSHALAIAHNQAKGMAVYDLLHGDALYKRLLCNRSDHLRWYVLQRRRPRFYVEDRLVGLVRSLRGAGRLVNPFCRGTAE